jgi:hypothetical protein
VSNIPQNENGTLGHGHSGNAVALVEPVTINTVRTRISCAT